MPGGVAGAQPTMAAPYADGKSEVDSDHFLALALALTFLAAAGAAVTAAEAAFKVERSAFSAAKSAEILFFRSFSADILAVSFAIAVAALEVAAFLAGVLAAGFGASTAVAGATFFGLRPSLAGGFGGFFTIVAFQKNNTIIVNRELSFQYLDCQ